PSSVLDGHLSRSIAQATDRPRRRLRGCSRLRASASNLLAAQPEIAAGRIALFTPDPEVRPWSLLLSPRRVAPPWCRSGLSTPPADVAPAFTGHPRSMQLGLSSGPGGQ